MNDEEKQQPESGEGEAGPTPESSEAPAAEAEAAAQAEAPAETEAPADEGSATSDDEAEVEDAPEPVADAEADDAEAEPEEGAAARGGGASRTASRERATARVDAIYGRKLGMLQLFDERGIVENVTAIEAGPCVVTMLRTPLRDGYSAIQLGWGEAKKLNRPKKGHLKEAGGDFRHLREVRVESAEEFRVGQEVGAEAFEAGDRVDVTANSKGRGFQGGVKRHNFRGGPKTHGQSDRHRAPGSIGAGTTPGHVLKGQKMAGHMGNATVTVRNLAVVRADSDKNILLVRGSVPGPINGLVRVKRTTRAAK
ncbi:MAG: 50S ribosomal protein L3 [Dehalococcoidia bacterium]|nr:50S ribosomal protein L3 [Dehalococcoidia bacterium]